VIGDPPVLVPVKVVHLTSIYATFVESPINGIAICPGIVAINAPAMF